MRTTIHREVRTVLSFCLLLLWALVAAGQGAFQNVGFENTTLSVFLVNPWGPYYVTNATLPGWNWSPHETGGFGDPDTTVAFNSIALDAPCVTLQGSHSPYFPSLRGEYSVLLQGGSLGGGLVTGNTNGASIYQTGLIPSTALSVIYFGRGSLRVAFDGHMLSSIAITNIANYTVWGVDISACAGQSGELRFTSPWLASGLLDDIRFSSIPIPEPSELDLCGLGVLVLFGAMKRLPSKGSERTEARRGGRL